MRNRADAREHRHLDADRTPEVGAFGGEVSERQIISYRQRQEPVGEILTGSLTSRTALTVADQTGDKRRTQPTAPTPTWEKHKLTPETFSEAGVQILKTASQLILQVNKHVTEQIGSNIKE